MNLSAKRKWATPQSTISELSLDGKFQCFLLEDVVRAPGVKVAGKTAIPAGKYEVVVTFSNRFQRPLPLLLKVPLFEGIRIHPGNTAADTEGCLLPGNTRGTDSVGMSRAAFDDLFAKTEAAAKKEKIWIEIV